MIAERREERCGNLAPAIVYSPNYNISFWGLERLHPFDSRKYGRAWTELRRTVGAQISRLHIPVDRAATDPELLLAHSADYLSSLRHPRSLAAALELPLLRFIPAWSTHWRVVRPMRWAVRGSVLAAKAALEHGLGINLSGGYHHAKRDESEGFCLFSDAAIAIRQLRAEGLLSPTGHIAYVDLDAHQGNGVCHQFMDDRSVFIFDAYNPRIYPAYDVQARERIDCDLPLPKGCRGGEYLSLLRQNLPAFLDSISRSERVVLGIYNAGTDVIEGDPLGLLLLSASDVLARDMFVVSQFRDRGIPLVTLTSGGYTRESYRLIATSVCEWVRHRRPGDS